MHSGVVPAWSWQPRQPGIAPEAQVQAWLQAQLAGEGGPVTLQRDARGRPQLCTPRACHDCNWSHSGDGLLVALGEHVAVGVDMEWRRPRPRALAVARALLHGGRARLAGCAGHGRRPRPRLPAAVVRQGGGAEGARPRPVVRAAPAALRGHGHRTASCATATPRSAAPATGACTSWCRRRALCGAGVAPAHGRLSVAAAILLHHEHAPRPSRRPGAACCARA